MNDKPSNELGLSSAAAPLKLSQLGRTLPVRNVEDAAAPSLKVALKLHRAGRIAEARAIYEGILRRTPQEPEVLYLAGIAACQLGNPANGVELLQQTAARLPQIAEVRFNLGNALRDLSRLDEAVVAYQQAIGLAPGYVKALTNLGQVLRQLGRLQEAVEAFGRITVCEPDLVVGHIGLGAVLLDQGQFERAAASFRTATELAPENVGGWRSLGKVLLDLGRCSEAAEVFRKVLALSPDHAADHLDLSVALKELGRIDDALTASRRALAVERDNVRALFHIASILERRGSIEEAREMASRGLWIDPSHTELQIVAARCERRAGNPTAGIKRLRALSTASENDDSRVSILFELGHLLDQVGAADEALRTSMAANDAARHRASSCEDDRLRHMAIIHRLAAAFSSEWVHSWTTLGPSATNEPAPVFLVGLPRSGTTLLELALDCHPELVSLDERPAVRALMSAIEQLPGGFISGLAKLDDEAASRLRRIYFEAAAEYIGPLQGRRLVDKLPLNILLAGPLVRVFPGAKFILALRHPCDVCLSCFMQHFELSPDMMNFASLELAADYYAMAMRLWQKYRSVLTFPCHSVKYEDIVADFDGAVRSLLEFIGVRWDDAVRDYAARAKNREVVATPSYGQVTEPIYGRARYRWHRYRRQLEPVLPVLSPFIREFGYAT